MVAFPPPLAAVCRGVAGHDGSTLTRRWAASARRRCTYDLRQYLSRRLAVLTVTDRRKFN